MFASRAYAAPPPSASTATPPQPSSQRPSYGYTQTASPQQPSYGYSMFGSPAAAASHSTANAQQPAAPFAYQSAPSSSTSHQPGSSSSAGPMGGWHAPYGGIGGGGGGGSQAPPAGSGQAATATPQGPKQFSWGLPIQNYTPKSAGDEQAQGSPESPAGAHGTPSSHTPHRPQNPLYPTFDADDEGPPRESAFGLDDDEMGSSPPPPAASTALVQHSKAAPAQHRADSHPSPAAQSGGVFSVTVFGFTPSSHQAVISAFRSIGDVVTVQAAPAADANWLTISYRRQWDATMALRKSGDIIAGSMIGVKWADGASSSASTATDRSSMVSSPTPSTRPPPPLGERVAVLSANEALKRPSSTASPAAGILARWTGVTSPAAAAAAAPTTQNGTLAPQPQHHQMVTSPHANLFKAGPADGARSNGGWSQAISNLVFGE